MVLWIAFLAFLLGFILGDMSRVGLLEKFPHLYLFVNWVKTHTVYYQAAKELEMLGQYSGLPIQITSTQWPGVVAIGMWAWTAVVALRGRAR